MNEIVDCNLAKYIFDRTAKKKNQQNKININKNKNKIRINKAIAVLINY
jgi:hypothetical protein